MGLRRVSRDFRQARPSWTNLALLALAGAVLALGQAPLGLWWLALPALFLLIRAVTRAAGPGEAVWIGWIAGGAYFGLVLHWIVEPFLVAPERHAWMAPFALILLALGLAMFWAAAAGLSVWMAATCRSVATAFALLFAGAEMARGYLFTGFPWALVGHMWIDTPVVQLAALTGAAGLTLLTFGLVALPLGFRRQVTQCIAGVVALAVLGGAWLWGSARLEGPQPETSLPVQLRLVQPDAPQHLKWRADMAEFFFQRHLALTAQPPEVGAPPPDLVIWSETAVPFLLEHPGAGLERMAEAAAGVPIAFGGQRVEEGRYFNSLILLDPSGAPVQIYDKHHLVPFGEYVPFAETILGAGYRGFAARQLTGYSPGPGPELMDFGPLGQVLPLICYEAVFPRHLRGTPRPDWLLQVTNDAWFGTFSGPYQHLAQARLRAVEQGLPLVRVANTGISAVIGPRGEVMARLPLDVSGALDAPLPGALPPTLYARTGDAPWAFLVVLGLVCSVVLRRRRQRH